MSILERLYMGTLYPYAKFHTNMENYKACREKALQSHAKLMEKLPDELKEEFNALRDRDLELLPYEFGQNFIDGFSIGVRMMNEVYANLPNTDEV